jgi:hypothetical protein
MEGSEKIFPCINSIAAAQDALFACQDALLAPITGCAAMRAEDEHCHHEFDGYADALMSKVTMRHLNTLWHW